MPKQRKILLGVIAGVALLIWWLTRPPRTLTLTGIVTTNDVIVSPMVAGQVSQLLVNEGDSVRIGQLLAVIDPGELAADRSYYQHSAAGFAAQADASAATLRFQVQQATEQIRQAEANLAATRAQQAEAQATLDNAKRNWDRADALAKAGQMAPQDADQSHTAWVVAQSRLDAVNKQVSAGEAAVALAHASADQVAATRSNVRGAEQQEAAAGAQAAKADVRFGYTELRAPVNGVVDVRPVRQGEVVATGQPVLTLIDPDALWIRGDVEESYAGLIRPGDSLDIRLPDGSERRGEVFYRGVDAGFATQRDVSRTKRDIKTFEIRVRVNNRDRRLAVGMTAYVLLPLADLKARAAKEEREIPPAGSDAKASTPTVMSPGAPAALPPASPASRAHAPARRP